MEEQIREIIKGNLQKLSKEELIETLADIFMAYSAFRMINAVSSIQCVTPPISSYARCINDQFARIQQSLSKLENEKDN